MVEWGSWRSQSFCPTMKRCLFTRQRSSICCWKKVWGTKLPQAAAQTWWPSRMYLLWWRKLWRTGPMRPKCGPILELLRTSSRYLHQNAKRSSKSTFRDKSANDIHYGRVCYTIPVPWRCMPSPLFSYWHFSSPVQYPCFLIWWIFYRIEYN